MKLWKLLLVFPAALVGAIYGSFASWDFTFGTIVPWLEMSHEWQKLGGLLIWFFGVWEIGASLYAAIFGLVALVVALVLMGISSAVSSKRRAG